MAPSPARWRLVPRRLWINASAQFVGTLIGGTRRAAGLRGVHSPGFPEGYRQRRPYRPPVGGLRPCAGRSARTTADGRTVRAAGEHAGRTTVGRETRRDHRFAARPGSICRSRSRCLRTLCSQVAAAIVELHGLGDGALSAVVKVRRRQLEIPQARHLSVTVRSPIVRGGLAISGIGKLSSSCDEI